MQSRFGRSQQAGSWCCKKVTIKYCIKLILLKLTRYIKFHKQPVSVCIQMYQSIIVYEANLYPWTKVEKSMLSTEPERQSGSRTEHRQRIFQTNFIIFFWASFSRKLIMSSHLCSDSSVFLNFYETFAVFPPWVTG